MRRGNVKRRALTGWLIAGLLVAGCGDDAAEPAPAPTPDSDASAEGDVLEGTISDAMIPLDELQSQAPAMAPETDAEEDGAEEAGAEEAGAEEDGADPDPDTSTQSD